MDHVIRGELLLELFATKVSVLLLTCVSPIFDSEAVGSSAITIIWTVWIKIHLFPPNKILEKEIL